MGKAAFRGLCFALTCARFGQVQAVRDNSVDRLTPALDLDDPKAPLDPLQQLQDAEEDASYMDCLRRWEEERRRQFAFMEGFTHLVSAERTVQRLHVSLRGFGHGRNLTMLVTDLQQRLSLLSRAGLRYAERLRQHVDELHPRLSERCKNATLDVEDLRNEILSAVASRRRRVGTLAKLKADMRQHTADYEKKRLARAPDVAPTPQVADTQHEAEATEAPMVAAAPAPTPQVAESTRVVAANVATQKVSQTSTMVTVVTTTGGQSTTTEVLQKAAPPAQVAANVATQKVSQTSTMVTAVTTVTTTGGQSTRTEVLQNAAPPAQVAANVATQKVSQTSTMVTTVTTTGGQSTTTEVLQKAAPPAQAHASSNETKANLTASQNASKLLDGVRPLPMLKAIRRTNPQVAAAKATNVLGEGHVDNASRQQVEEELFDCRLEDNLQDVDLANDPSKFTLPCLIGAPMIRCSPWVLEPETGSATLWSKKVKLQSYWILLLGAVLLFMFGFSWYRQQVKKKNKEALGKKSKEELQAMEERALSSEFHRFFGGYLQSSIVVMVVDLIAALIPISNVIIHALATEDLLELKVPLQKSLLAGPIANFCARWHDTWMLASMIILILFQVVRAFAAQGHYPYNVYGGGAWLVYLATDISAMGDTVAILLTGWSLLICRAVRWNWMIFSFIRVIESLGRWGIGVNFYGFSEEVNEDQRMIRALAVFGLVIWILIGSLYYVGNDKNEHSKWEYANVPLDPAVASDTTLPKWQRFESIPSSMFFALLTLNKKNPLAHVFVTWYEKLMVVFVNICCVPLFSLVSSMIGGTIMQLVLSQEKESATPTEQAEGTTPEELEDEEEEEEEEEVDEEVQDPAEEEAQVPYWQQWKDFFESLTWEEHLHPAAIALLGFGSLIFYGLSTAGRGMQRWRSMQWLFFEFDHPLPPWGFPMVDGLVGGLFLADWLHSSVSQRRRSQAEAREAEDEEVEAQSTGTANVYQSMSIWRHIAYFLSSVPGMVNLLLCVLEVALSDYKDVGKGLQFYCLCCLWRIYLLERWLDHPFSAAADALYTCRKQLITTGAVSLFFWFLGAHLLFFTEYDNPDSKIREFYGSVMRSIWASSFYLNGEWVFCDFTWAGKAVGGFIVLFGVSIVVVPMSVFTGYFLMNLQGDFYQNQVRFLKAETKDLWQLKMQPGPDAAQWRKQLFELLYEHLIQLNEGLQAKTLRLHDSVSQKSLSRPFQFFKWTSISASLVFACLTILENAEYMNTKHCEDIAEGSGRAFFNGSEENCVNFVKQVDAMEYHIDLVFLHFFVLEFILRVVALGWRHFCSELGVAEMLSITGLLISLTQLRDDALHHPERLRPGYSERGKNENLLLGSVTFLRLTRLISIGSYFGLLRALRKVNWIARWSLCKSFYFLVAVWFTHAMLLHMAEGTNYTAALAGAQILPAAPPNTLWMSEIPKPPLPLPHHSLLQNATDIPNASLTNISNVSNTSNVSDVSDFRALSKGFSDTTYVLVNVSNLSNPKPVLFIPKMLNQSHRFGDYLSAMQYSLQHLTGDYPIVEYSILGKTVLLMGLIIGTCAVAAWTAIFSSSMVNYLANEAEDQLARAAERRMLLAIDVVLRLQRQWRRRKRAREAARARGELPEPVAQHPTSESREGLFLRIRNKARRLVLRHTATGERLMRFFQSVLVFNIALSMIHSLPEIKNHPVAEKGQVFEEMVCTVIFSFEFGLMLVAGKGRQGSHWYLFRFVDFICIFPGIMQIYQMRSEWQRLHQLDEKIKKSGEDEWIQDYKIAIDAFQMIRVIRVLFWHQWQHEVQVVVDGIVSAGPIMVLPAFLSLFIWVMSSAMFVWMENVYDGPSKEFFTSVPTAMYWTSSFLIGEWVLADFSPGGGNRVCIAIVLFGIMGFGIATGILMEAVQQAIAVAMLENTSFEDLAKMAEEDKAPRSQKADKASSARSGKPLVLPTGRSAQLRRAAKVAAMTKQMAERES